MSGTSIPPGLPSEGAQGPVQAHREAHLNPVEAQALSVMGQARQQPSRAPSLRQHNLEVLTSAARASSPKGSFQFYQKLGLREEVYGALAAIDDRQFSDFNSSMIMIDSMGSDRLAQYTAFTDFESGVQESQILDPQTKEVFRQVLSEVTLTKKVSYGQHDLYWNRQGITVTGLANPTPAQAQQVAQQALSQGIVPQKSAQQFSTQIPNAQGVTTQQAQASQQKGKAAASQCLATLNQVAQDIALEQTAEKEGAKETKKPETSRPSAQPTPQQRASSTEERVVLRKTSGIFQAVKGKSAETTEHLKELQQQREAQHAEILTEKRAHKKEEQQKILKEQIAEGKVKEEELS